MLVYWDLLGVQLIDKPEILMHENVLIVGV